MAQNFLSKLAEKEEHHQVPEYSSFDDYANHQVKNEADAMDEQLESFLGFEEDGCQLLNWDFMDWNGLSFEDEDEEEEDDDDHGERQKVEDHSTSMSSSQEESHFFIKQESYCGFCDYEEKNHDQVSLNLSLNYQDVLDAWSDRGTPWAAADSAINYNTAYMGEVPTMEEDKTRREASVLRYKEKRQTRLFSKKIRYQVRKLNADKRPRLKGRFVKRAPEKIPR